MIPKLAFNHCDYQDSFNNVMDTFFKDEDPSNSYVIQIYIEQEKTRDGVNGLIIHDFFIENLEQLKKELYLIYNKRGRAIWYGKLTMKKINDSTDTKLKKSDIYGKNILLYTKPEKFFLCRPKDCRILFSRIIDNYSYNLDFILRTH